MLNLFKINNALPWMMAVASLVAFVAAKKPNASYQQRSLIIAIVASMMALLSSSAAQAQGPVSEVDGGAFHTCALKSDNTVACWGSNTFGEATAPSGSFKQVSGGRHHTCAVKSDDTVACWGSNSSGEATAPGGSFKQVSAGLAYTCAVKSDNTVACWGYNGNNEASPPGGSFKQVSAGVGHTCALKSDDTVECWGFNGSGQASPPGGSFKQVSVGNLYTCGLKSDNTVECWGNNSSGQLSPPGGSFKQVSAGDGHICALKSDDTIACWGRNFEGQTTSPGGNFKQVSAGRYHTCAVKSDDTLACWGLNNVGQASPPEELTTPPSQPTGSLTIIKVAAPLDGTDFQFNISGQDLDEDFSLDDEASQSDTVLSQKIYSNLPTGTYTIVESFNLGWRMKNATCVGAGGNVNLFLSTRTLSVPVGEDEDITCTFFNERFSSVVFTKDATPADGTDFTFTTDIPGLETFQIDDEGGGGTDGVPTTQGFGSVIPGQYTVTENLSGNWTLDDISCTSREGISTIGSFTPGSTSIDLDIAPGDEISCIVTNTLANQPPTADPGGPYSGSEGSAVAFAGSGSSDPDGDALTYSWVFGDGNNGSGATPSHTYADNGSYTVCLTVSDGSLSDQQCTVADIANVAPTIDSLNVSPTLFAVGESATGGVIFSDPGTLDTHTAQWDWGDGTAPGTVTQGAGSGSVANSHSYNTPGIYTVMLTVTDKDGGSDTATFSEFIVVYDPDGGFVTGGGWIDSPAGAYVDDPDLTGKANFGFVSKYKKGAQTPVGETEFQFKAGNLNFHSNSYEWLVVANHRAQYKGDGTINGGGDYGFMLTAIDANLTPSTDTDLFRIKIWDKGTDTVVYDNQMGIADNDDPTTQIGGGSIIIHTK